MRQKEEDRAMNVEYWKPLVEEYEGRTIQAEYARDDAYVRVRVSGGAALATKLAEQPPGQLILPEETLEGVIADIDAMLKRPAQELEHARALEVGIVYFEHLDRLLNAAIVRRNAILADIERYDYLFPAPLALSAVVEQMQEAANGPTNGSKDANAKLDEVMSALAPSEEGQS
jgi:hypothetical protein